MISCPKITVTFCNTTYRPAYLFTEPIHLKGMRVFAHCVEIQKALVLALAYVMFWLGSPGVCFVGLSFLFHLIS